MIFLFYSVYFLQTILVAAQDICLPTRCFDSGPVIRFPFRIKGRQPEHCGYPGFDLSCNPINNITEFEFQFPVKASTNKIVIPLSAKASVQEIDYKLQVIHVSVPAFGSPASAFEMFYQYNGEASGYTLFNCSAKPEANSYSGPITCLGSSKYQVYAFRSFYSVSEFPLSSCVKMYNISDVSEVIFRGLPEYYTDDTQLHWSTPFCGNCESTGKQCRFKNNGTNNETECFEIPKQPENDDGASKKRVILGVSIGLFSFVLVVVALYGFYRVKKRNENKRIEQFLEDYKALRPARYSYADIKKITNGFRSKLGKGGYGTVFKGKLSNDILVAVKMDIDALLCTNSYLMILSISSYLNQSRTLGWEKLHKIALGIAKGIDYLHQGCNQRILHFDIKPHNILLDHNLSPKVADFGLAKMCSKDQSVVTMTAARGTIGYIAPEVFSRNFGNVSYKSDIYSYSTSSEEGRTSMLEQLTWYPADRPSMKVVIQMLEGENMPVKPPNPFAASESVNINTTATSGSLFSGDLDCISETNGSNNLVSS
ncbi:rust resistance kinase Lr10-like [Olea europaea subsp. europaea]|uniref:non-specific serine/threonine protein kinase n=1 Tax=Olea europaea subsp. europaea TaxID=158383 RepID=A0A8S0TPP1_OLEEU|nr:rust resistance kinase Lr10-like [Olea europaea subsp. europaea]